MYWPCTRASSRARPPAQTETNPHTDARPRIAARRRSSPAGRDYGRAPTYGSAPAVQSGRDQPVYQPCSPCAGRVRGPARAPAPLLKLKPTHVRTRAHVLPRAGGPVRPGLRPRAHVRRRAGGLVRPGLARVLAVYAGQPAYCSAAPLGPTSNRQMKSNVKFEHQTNKNENRSLTQHLSCRCRRGVSI